MEREQLDPQAALAAIADQRRGAAERLVTPWWYHPALGLLVGGFVAARAFDSPLVQVLTLVVFFVALALLVQLYRRRTGVWITGYRRGAAGRVTALLVAVYLAAIFGAYLVEGVGAFLAAGAVIAAATVVLGHRFDAAVQEELLG
jgi:hypothetical protein